MEGRGHRQGTANAFVSFLEEGQRILCFCWPDPWVPTLSSAKQN
jgi:hypothetical protein